MPQNKKIETSPGAAQKCKNVIYLSPHSFISLITTFLFICYSCVSVVIYSIDEFSFHSLLGWVWQYYFVDKCFPALRYISNGSNTLIVRNHGPRIITVLCYVFCFAAIWHLPHIRFFPSTLLFVSIDLLYMLCVSRLVKMKHTANSTKVKNVNESEERERYYANCATDKMEVIGAGMPLLNTRTSNDGYLGPTRFIGHCIIVLLLTVFMYKEIVIYEAIHYSTEINHNALRIFREWMTVVAFACTMCMCAPPLLILALRTRRFSQIIRLPHLLTQKSQERKEREREHEEEQKYEYEREEERKESEEKREEEELEVSWEDSVQKQKLKRGSITQRSIKVLTKTEKEGTREPQLQPPQSSLRLYNKTHMHKPRLTSTGNEGVIDLISQVKCNWQCTLQTLHRPCMKGVLALHAVQEVCGILTMSLFVVLLDIWATPLCLDTRYRAAIVASMLFVKIILELLSEAVLSIGIISLLSTLKTMQKLVKTMKNYSVVYRCVGSKKRCIAMLLLARIVVCMLWFLIACAHVVVIVQNERRKTDSKETITSKSVATMANVKRLASLSIYCLCIIRVITCVIEIIANYTLRDVEDEDTVVFARTKNISREMVALLNVVRFASRVLTLIVVIVFWTFLDIVNYMFTRQNYNGISKANNDVNNIDINAEKSQVSTTTTTTATNVERNSIKQPINYTMESQYHSQQQQNQQQQHNTYTSKDYKSGNSQTNATLTIVILFFCVAFVALHVLWSSVFTLWAWWRFYNLEGRHLNFVRASMGKHQPESTVKTVEDVPLLNNLFSSK